MVFLNIGFPKAVLEDEIGYIRDHGIEIRNQIPGKKD